MKVQAPLKSFNLASFPKSVSQAKVVITGKPTKLTKTRIPSPSSPDYRPTREGYNIGVINGWSSRQGPLLSGAGSPPAP